MTNCKALQVWKIKMLKQDKNRRAANIKSAITNVIIVLFLSTGTFICKLFYTLFMVFEIKVLYARMPCAYNRSVEI